MVGFRGGDNAGDDWYIWLLVEMSMRWVNFKERSPSMEDADSNRDIVVRYTSQGRIFHRTENWRSAGLSCWLPEVVEWLDYRDSQISSEQNTVPHIRKVEL